MAESKYGIPNIDRFSRHCFYVGLGVGAVLLLAVSGISLFGIDLRRLIPECMFHRITGYYCCGCGGTRACQALLQGRLLLSLWYHPVVLYFLVGYLVFMASHLIHFATRRKVRALRFCPPYFYLAIAILLTQCIVKNIALWRGMDLLHWADRFAGMV